MSLFPSPEWRLPIVMLVGIAWFGASCAHAAERQVMSLEATVDATRPASQRLEMTLVFEGLPAVREFRALGQAPGYQYHDLRFLDARGRFLAWRREGPRYILRRPVAGGRLTLRYLVQPGGPGRHGHQGYVHRNYAVAGGGILILPARRVPDDIVLRFRKPRSWRVAGALVGDGESYRWPGETAEMDHALLAKRCFALGPFDGERRRLGGMEVRVYTYAPWPDDHRARLYDRTFRMLEFFNRVLGHDTGLPLAVVWTPRPTMRHLFGGSSPTSICFDQERDVLRNWELLAHRLAHGFNRDAPSGMVIRDPRDRWFVEGWAGYIEIVAADALDLVDAERRWVRLHGIYRRWLQEHPGYEIAMAREQTVTDGDQVEFLHYLKGPLVVRLLDRVIRARSDGDLQDFMAQAARKRGHMRGTLPLREALRDYAGVPLDAFWQVVVDRSFVIPVPGSAEDASLIGMLSAPAD